MKVTKNQEKGDTKHNYEQNVRKLKRNSGEKYRTGKLKHVSATLFENKDCLCQFLFFLEISKFRKTEFLSS